MNLLIALLMKNEQLRTMQHYKANPQQLHTIQK